MYGGGRTGVKGGLWTDRLLSLKARALLAAVSLTAAWQRNLFHSKRRLNGPADSAATCEGRPLRFGNGGYNKALMPAQAAGLSPYNNMWEKWGQATFLTGSVDALVFGAWTRGRAWWRWSFASLPSRMAVAG